MGVNRRRNTQDEHRQLLLALQARDGERAAAIMHSHIARRRDQIVAQVREGYARSYVWAAEMRAATAAESSWGS